MIYLITLKLIVRSWWRNKMFFLISLFSLTIGIACTNLLITFVIHEYNIEKSNPDKERIFCLLQDDPMKDGKKTLFIVSDIPVLIKEKYAEVEDVLRLGDAKTRYCQYQNEIYEKLHIVQADSSLLHFFPYGIVAGNLEEVLHQPNKLALSEQMAHKIFGKKNPIGEKLTIEYEYGEPKTYEVSAIIKERIQSFIKFDLLTSAEHENLWGGTTLLKLRPGTSPHLLIEKLRRDKIPTLLAGKGEYDIVPLQDIYLTSESKNMESIGNTSYIQHRDTQLLLIGLLSAILILLIACFNYTNLGLSRMVQQIKSMHVEKLMGATLRDIRRQLFLDTFLIVFLAFLLSFLLINDALPTFNQLLFSQLTFPFFFNPQILPVILLFILLLAGIPAFYISRRLSRMSLSEYKQSFAGRKKQHLIAMLVTMQFIISTGLIFATLATNRQFNVVKEKGERYKNTIEIGCMDGAAMGPLKQVLKQIPTITNMAVSGGSVLDAWARELEVKKPDGTVQVSSLLQIFSDYDFLNTMNIRQLKGDNPEALTHQYAYPVLINEAYVKLLIPEGREFIGHPLKEYDSFADSIYVIGGVVEDFLINAVDRSVIPSMLHFVPQKAQENFHYIQIRMDKNNTQETIKEIKRKWDELYLGKSFTYMDIYQTFLERNKKILTLYKVFSFYSIVSILLTCFGLFGISRYAVRQRIREIGIRKVHGAKNRQIIWLLNRPFIWQIILAYAIAMPISWWLMQKWLEQFAYRTLLSVWIFILPLLIVSVVTIITVTLHSYWVARGSLVDSLNTE